MQLIQIFANTILPIFLIAGAGFALARYMHADPRTISNLVFYLLSPALIFDALVTSTLSPAETGRMALFSFCMICASGLIAWLLSFPLRLDRATGTIFVIVAMFANAGNYGLPLVLFAFGQEALSRATVYFVMHVILLYTIGIIMASSGKAGIRTALRNLRQVPHLYAIVVAAVVVATGVTVPDAMMRPVGLLSDAALPMMIVLMGMQLAKTTLPERPLVVGVATAIRLVILPLIALGMAALFGLTGPDRQAAVIEAAMPAAVMVTVLSVQFEAAPAFATAVVFLSTVLSPLTLTPLIMLLQR
jgi:predicted permease